MYSKGILRRGFLRNRDPLTYYIQKRIRENKNFLLPILGQTGAGKSWSGLRLCENVDPEFNINRVIFNSRDFMSLINSNELHKGSAILFDEAGVNVSNREWYKKENISLGKVIETFRHKNYVVFFTVPNIDFIDIKLRKLMHGKMDILSRDSVRNVTIGRLLLYDGFNYFDNQQMTKYLKISTAAGTKRITRMLVPKPSLELRRAYEKKKKEFTSKLNIEAEELMMKRPELLMKDVQFKIIDLYKKGMEMLEIARQLDLPLTTVSKLVNLGVGKDIVKTKEKLEAKDAMRLGLRNMFKEMKQTKYEIVDGKLLANQNVEM